MEKVKRLLAFLQGLAICNNVLYIFNYNTFYLNISCLISLISLIYIFIMERKKISIYLKKIDMFFYLFLFCCLLSIVPMFFYFNNDLSLTNAFFNGMPSLVLIFIQYFTIVALYDCKKNMFYGILFGFIINILYSVMQYIFFQMDGVITLYNLFPNPAFQVPGNYNILNSTNKFASAFKIYAFRAQGLFLETSYFLTFIIGSILLVISLIKSKILKLVIILITIWLCTISESGNLIILFLVLILYFLLTFFNNKKLVFNRRMILFIPFLLVICCLVFCYICNDSNIINNISDSLFSADISSAGNEERFISMKRGIDLILKYPFGVGYNMSSTIYEMEYGNEYTNAIFSTLLVNELELGVLGNVIYVLFSMKVIILSFRKKDKLSIAFGLSALGLFLCQITNGISYWLMIYIISIFALTNARIKETSTYSKSQLNCEENQNER